MAARGPGRSTSIRRRISAKSCLGMATSASWKVTLRLWRTTLAPILISFSRKVVNDQCSTASGSLAVSQLRDRFTLD
jgi:hypothetical protein